MVACIQTCLMANIYLCKMLIEKILFLLTVKEDCEHDKNMFSVSIRSFNVSLCYQFLFGTQTIFITASTIKVTSNNVLKSNFNAFFFFPLLFYIFMEGNKTKQIKKNGRFGYDRYSIIDDFFLVTF